MMKRSFRDAWVAKLQSGEYKQGKNCLHKEDEFCCLGVAYEVDDCGCEREIISNKVEIYWDYFGYSSVFPRGDHLQAWGLTTTEANMLANMNDRGYTFNQIADKIETFPVSED